MQACSRARKGTRAVDTQGLDGRSAVQRGDLRSAAVLVQTIDVLQCRSRLRTWQSACLPTGCDVAVDAWVSGSPLARPHDAVDDRVPELGDLEVGDARVTVVVLARSTSERDQRTGTHRHDGDAT